MFVQESSRFAFSFSCGYRRIDNSILSLFFFSSSSSSSSSHLPTLHNRYILVRLVSGGPSLLDHSNDVHAIDDLAKHDMFVVQEGRRGGRDKELTAIGIWAGVLVQRFSRSSNGKKNRLLACRVYSTRVNMTYRHTQKTWAVMWQRKILICKLGGAVNGAAACAVAIYEIATLNHEILNLSEVSRKSLALSIEMGGECRGGWIHTTRWNLLPL